MDARSRLRHALFVVGVNPVLHVDQIPEDFPDRERLVRPQFVDEHGAWIEPGNTVIVGPSGALIAGPVREREETLIAELDLAEVAASCRFMDPTGRCNRPDIFPAAPRHHQQASHQRHRGCHAVGGRLSILVVEGRRHLVRNAQVVRSHALT